MQSRAVLNRPQRVVIASAASLLLLWPASIRAESSASSEVSKGRFVLGHADNFTSSRANFSPMLEQDNGAVLRLDFRGALVPSISPGSRVRVQGVRHGGAIVVADGGVSADSGSTASNTTSAGTKRIAVVLFNFSNDRSEPYTPSYAAGIAFTNANSVAAYYSESSWGQLKLTGDVYGWYSIPDSNTSCSYSTWASSANKAASAAGIDLGTYDNIVYGFPSTSSCGWTGYAYMPGKYSWLNGNGMTLRGMAHELGHNFGTHHAQAITCRDNGVQVPLSGTTANCSITEYGDPFTVMGSGQQYEHTNFARGNFGWLQTANTVTANVAGDYLLKPIETYDSSGVQVLRIQRTSSTFFTLEFRQPSSPFDTFSWPASLATSGVTVRLAPSYSSRTQSQLIDATPGSAYGFLDAALATGKTLVDPLTGISITVVAISSNGATVRVSFGTDTSLPTQPGSLTATTPDPNRVMLSWNASTDDVAVAGYRIYRDATLVASVAVPGYIDSGLAAATSYTYQVVAFDAAGNTSTSATVTAITPTAPTTTASDKSAPSTPTNLAAAFAKGKKVTLSWDASTDNVGVAGYYVYRNGSLAGTTTGTGYTDTLGGKASTATFYVVAYDAAGNASPPSNSITAQQ
jgi:hypothetical protein